MFLYMQDNVLRRAGKCCATVSGMFLYGEDFVDEAGGETFILEEKFGRAVPIVCASRIADEKFGFFAGSGNNDENKIVMTTHSPCVLSYITLAAKSYELMNKGVKCDFSTQKQNERQ